MQHCSPLTMLSTPPCPPPPPKSIFFFFFFWGGGGVRVSGTLRPLPAWFSEPLRKPRHRALSPSFDTLRPDRKCCTLCLRSCDVEYFSTYHITWMFRKHILYNACIYIYICKFIYLSLFLFFDFYLFVYTLFICMFIYIYIHLYIFL